MEKYTLMELHLKHHGNVAHTAFTVTYLLDCNGSYLDTAVLCQFPPVRLQVNICIGDMIPHHFEQQAYLSHLL